MIKKLTNHILSYLISSNAIDDNEETKDYYRSVSYTHLTLPTKLEV